MKITELLQTCSACPSQWEAKLEDGRMLYVRYRWGYLSVCRSSYPTDNVYEAVGGEEVFGQQIGDDMNGCMSTSEMLSHTGLEMAVTR